MPTACIAALVLATASSQPASAEESPVANAEERAVARAEAAFAEERFAEAADAFAEAYAARPLPRYLWAGAQAERLAKDCAAAIDLYDAFLATGPTEKDARDARDARRACADELAKAKPPKPAPEPNVEPEPAPPPPPKADAAGKERPPLRWYRDPWGGALVGSGVFVGGIGVGLLVSAVRLDRDASEASTEGAYEASREDAVLRQRVGIATVSVGSALVVAGVVRWVIVGTRGRRDRDRDRAALLPSAHGITLVGRF